MDDINANYWRNLFITGKNSKLVAREVSLSCQCISGIKRSKKEKKEMLFKLHFYVLTPNCDQRVGYFVDREPPLNYMGRLIRLLVANGDIKIQECRKQDTAEREESIFMVCPLARPWWMSNALVVQFPKFADAFTRRKTSAPPVRHGPS